MCIYLYIYIHTRKSHQNSSEFPESPTSTFPPSPPGSQRVPVWSTWPVERLCGPAIGHDVAPTTDPPPANGRPTPARWSRGPHRFFPSTSHLMTPDWWKVHVTSCKFCMFFFSGQGHQCHSWSRTIFKCILNTHVGYCRVLQLYAAPKREVEALKETNYSPSRPIVGTALNYVLQSVRQGPIAIFKTASKHIKPNTQTISEEGYWITILAMLPRFKDLSELSLANCKRHHHPLLQLCTLESTKSKECQYSQETKHGTHTDRKERKKGRKERKEGLGKGGREERRTKNDKNEKKAKRHPMFTKLETRIVSLIHEDFNRMQEVIRERKCDLRFSFRLLTLSSC